MHPMMKLLIDNRKKGDFRAEQSGNEATLYIYDVIVADEFEAEYWGGVAPESFVKAVRDIEADVIHLRINSPGGSVFAARSMEQALREHPAKVIAHIDGYAASAATFISMAADEVVMNQGGFFMIHKAMTVAYGNADELVDTADLLEKIDSTLVGTYHNRTGQDKDQIAQWMADETWFTAEEAVENGFADRVENGAKAENKAWNLSAYQNAPEQKKSANNSDEHKPLTEEQISVIVGRMIADEKVNDQSGHEPDDTTNTDELKRQLQLKSVA